jgi:hypothetical protein
MNSNGVAIAAFSGEPKATACFACRLNGRLT